MKESEMATMIRENLSATWPDKTWQVRARQRPPERLTNTHVPLSTSLSFHTRCRYSWAGTSGRTSRLKTNTTFIFTLGKLGLLFLHNIWRSLLGQTWSCSLNQWSPTLTQHRACSRTSFSR
jgi:hypothetical protein